jgi:hypothetical protein
MSDIRPNPQTIHVRKAIIPHSIAIEHGLALAREKQVSPVIPV